MAIKGGSGLGTLRSFPLDHYSCLLYRLDAMGIFMFFL